MFWPLLLSWGLGSSPPSPTAAELRLHSPRRRAARHEPAASRSPRSAHGHVQPFHGRRTRDKINELKDVKKKKWLHRFVMTKKRCLGVSLHFPGRWTTPSIIISEFVTFAATSALISSCVSASRFLASSVRRSQSAMKDWRCSAACERTHETNQSLWVCVCVCNI